jgi:hypothetical protein
MNLPMRTKVTHYVDYTDLEQFIVEAYGFTYEIVAAEECSNDTTLNIEVTGVLDTYDIQNFNKLRSGEWVPFCTQLILDVLAHSNKIPAGMYNIRICW